jgi:predicted transposase/invertase (TIGR01784 family)
MLEQYETRFEKRFIQGIEKGREEGREEGVEQGRQEERINLALNLLKTTNLSLELIAQSTTLSLEKIRALSESIKSR